MGHQGAVQNKDLPNYVHNCVYFYESDNLPLGYGALYSIIKAKEYKRFNRINVSSFKGD